MERNITTTMAIEQPLSIIVESPASMITPMINIVALVEAEK